MPSDLVELQRSVMEEIAQLERRILNNPNQAEARHDLGVAYFQIGNVLARTAKGDALSSETGRAIGFWEKSLSLLNEKTFDGALIKAQTLSLIAYSCVQRNELLKSDQHFRICLDLINSFPGIKFENTFDYIVVNFGKFQSADKFWQTLNTLVMNRYGKVVSTSKDSTDCHHLIEQMTFWNLIYLLIPKVIDLPTPIQKREWNIATRVCFELGRIHLIQGKLEEALSFLNEAIFVQESLDPLNYNDLLARCTDLISKSRYPHLIDYLTYFVFDEVALREAILKQRACDDYVKTDNCASS